jgi:hypothetical protein
MSIVIHTCQGTFIVSQEKEAALISWLQQNAILAGQVKEQVSADPNIRQLINEDKGREF